MTTSDSSVGGLFEIAGLFDIEGAFFGVVAPPFNSGVELGRGRVRFVCGNTKTADKHMVKMNKTARGMADPP